MNLDQKKWKEFKLNKIYKIRMGNKFDKNKLDLDIHEVNLVSRISYNNGVDVKCAFVEDIKPFEPGLLTVALGGSYLGSCFIQYEPFYTAQNVAVMESLYPEMNLYVNLFISCLIRYECHEKFQAFGRELNTHINTDFTVRLPICFGEYKKPIINSNKIFSKEGYIPDWKFMENYIKSLHYKPLTTTIRNYKPFKYNNNEWREFLLSDYFEIFSGKYHYPSEYDEGKTPYYSASSENNGISQFIDLSPDFDGNCIVTGKIGCTAFYAPEPFCATSDVNIFMPKFKMSRYVALFIISVLNYSENYRWAYGRQCRVGNSMKIAIHLPSKDGKPDWEFMESYMKALPYSDCI